MKGYYGKLLNDENLRPVFGEGVPNEGLPPAIIRNETRKGNGTGSNSSGGLEAF